jgi:hypothetical protein
MPRPKKKPPTEGWIELKKEYMSTLKGRTFSDPSEVQDEMYDFFFKKLYELDYYMTEMMEYRPPKKPPTEK